MVQPMSQKNLNSAEINRHIGKKIVEARKNEGVTQQQLADFLGISRIAMSSYETGRTRIAIPHLFLIGKALGKRIEFFIEDIFDSIKPKKLPKKELTFNIDENVKFELEMSLRNYLNHIGIHKNEISSLVDSILKKVDKMANQS